MGGGGVQLVVAALARLEVQTTRAHRQLAHNDSSHLRAKECDGSEGARKKARRGWEVGGVVFAVESEVQGSQTATPLPTPASPSRMGPT